MPARYHSVSGVLEHKAIFAEYAPVFMIITDREKTALLEIAPQGKYSLSVVENGVLTHANHYLAQALLGASKKRREDSLGR